MRNLTITVLRLVCREASGPFSYLTKNGLRRTVLRGSFSSDEEFTIVDFKPERYLARCAHNDAVLRIKELTKRIASLASRCELIELEKLEIKLTEALAEVSLRYQNDSKISNAEHNDGN